MYGFTRVDVRSAGFWLGSLGDQKNGAYDHEIRCWLFLCVGRLLILGSCIHVSQAPYFFLDHLLS
ncbi:hypothetical protein BT69DRAFT_207339 [Atractiella rhizophila]|nr:hypothetical protein BT69DRAFT_207339 [Atractiella rhizophila]